MRTIHIQVKDQFDVYHMAKAVLKELADSEDSEQYSLEQKVDFIEIYGERILPSTELLFQSEANCKIYKVIEN
ncbi:hypothetical protein [Acinetobacter brisouii]|jgi:hypothetical protein|uniref:hypothetical protein n=1 Tax=Acinetobacter brisouii TaxID=396323 RepID=UPI0005F77BC2|nr:hypothetical protein [Acinetobacter brisouii]KJV38961.1 hypothetical protein VH98_06665 [Acinetobacter brisouii]